MYIGVLFFYAFSMFCITFHKKCCLGCFSLKKRKKNIQLKLNFFVVMAELKSQCLLTCCEMSVKDTVNTDKA